MKSLTHIWIDSRISNLKDSEIRVEELQGILTSYNAIAFYKGCFYDKASEIPLRLEVSEISRFGLPTGMSIEVNPVVTIVPQGTTIESSYIGKRFVFPEIMR